MIDDSAPEFPGASEDQAFNEAHSSTMHAAEQMDWQQVVLNGGPPCFHIDASNFLFCGRAERWAGHGVDHAFTSLADLLRASEARQEEINTHIKKWKYVSQELEASHPASNLTLWVSAYVSGLEKHKIPNEIPGRYYQ